MTDRQCAHCERPLPAAARAHAKYCGTSCRVMASRARKNGSAAPALAVEPVTDTPKLPAALTRRARWIRRAASKFPLQADGSAATSDDESTWTTYADAAASAAGAGLGFVLNGDGIVCVDIDHCITDGVLSAEAEAFLASLPETYIEVSPSGDGLHIWGRGMVLTSRKFRNGNMQGEIIGARKYATVTGNRFRCAPLTLANIAAQAGPLIY